MEIARKDIKKKCKLAEVKKGNMFLYGERLLIRSFVNVGDINDFNIPDGKIICFCIESSGIASGRMLYLDENVLVQEADGKLEWWLA